MAFKPLKRFGQNYLVDQNIINKIVKEIAPVEEDILVEIGPGRGALTAALYKTTNKYYAVEIDTRAIEELKSKFPDTIFIQSDFLKVNLNDFIEKPLKIAGNIPYNLTSPIIFKLLENNLIVSDAVLMVQYEVAKRITSGRGTKDYGILSVILNYFGNVKFCFKISPNVFFPKPNVNSALIHIFFNKKREDVIFNKAFIKIVKASFGNRRKTLKNSLSNSVFHDFDFKGADIDLSLRAEALEVDDFVKLTNYYLNSTTKN